MQEFYTQLLLPCRKLHGTWEHAITHVPFCVGVHIARNDCWWQSNEWYANGVKYLSACTFLPCDSTCTLVYILCFVGYDQDSLT